MLRTAVSAKQPDGLGANAKIIDAQYAEKKLSDEQSERFRSIISAARSGGRAGAQSQAFTLATGQRAQ